MQDKGGGIMKYVVLALLALGLGIVGWRLLAPSPTDSNGAQRSVVVPQLSAG